MAKPAPVKAPPARPKRPPLDRTRRTWRAYRRMRVARRARIAAFEREVATQLRADGVTGVPDQWERARAVAAARRKRAQLDDRFWARTHRRNRWHRRAARVAGRAAGRAVVASGRGIGTGVILCGQQAGKGTAWAHRHYVAPRVRAGAERLYDREQRVATDKVNGVHHRMRDRLRSARAGLTHTTCGACGDSVRRGKLPDHFYDQHAGPAPMPAGPSTPVRTPRGGPPVVPQARPQTPATPTSSGPQYPTTPPRLRVVDQQGNTEDRLTRRLRVWRPSLNTRRQQMAASSGAIQTVSEFGERAPRNLTDIRGMGAEMEQVAGAFASAVAAHRQYVTSGAPEMNGRRLDPSVTQHLQGATESLEQAEQAMAKYMAAFEDVYGPAIREAQQETTLDTQWLTDQRSA